MGTEIDNRIVEIQFNNGQFENNIHTSIRSLDTLKGSLNLDSATKSLTELDRAGKSFSLAGIADGVSNISSKFTAMGAAAFTIISNLTTAVMQKSQQLFNALVIEPRKMGFSEYETKMNAVQTILTNTASKGTTLKDVTDTLDELNEYSDKTIYNFAQMADNAGKFTAAGVGLKESTTAIKGLANLAAGVGVSNERAQMAMYQLSQALANGKIQLMDWRSVINAGMGGEIFQNGLKQSAKELGIMVDESVSFNDSLQDGWATSEVLLKTLAKFADDPKLLAAAQDVKTLTQLYGTLKETAQSGWAKTWETIIGNNEEAKVIFTELNNFFGGYIQRAADARNAALGFWKEQGGRDAILLALQNVINGIAKAMDAIGKAFRDVFQPIRGRQLVDFSEKIRKLSYHFIMGEDTANKLRETFRGIFSIFGMAKQIIGGVVNLFGTLIGRIFNLNITGKSTADTILTITAFIGRFLTSLEKAMKKMDLFGFAVDTINTVFDFLAKRIEIVKEALSSLKFNIDFSAFKEFGIGSSFLQGGLEGDFSILEAIGNVLQRISKVIKDAIDTIKGAFAKLKEALNLPESDYETFVDVLSTTLIGAVIWGLKTLGSSLNNLMTSLSGLAGKATAVLDGVRNVLVSYQNSIKAGIIMKIAQSIALLAAALYVVSIIDQDKLITSLKAITAMILQVIGSLALLTKIKDPVSSFLGIMKLSMGMVALSAAVLLLAGAIKVLSSLDWKQTLTGCLAVIALIAALTLSLDFLNKGIDKGTFDNSTQLIKTAFAMVILAGAIKLLANSVEKLGKLDIKEIGKGLLALGGILVSLGVFMKYAGSMGLSQGVGILVLAGTMFILMEVIKRFSTMDPSVVIKGLVIMTGLLSVLAMFVAGTKNASANIFATSAALLVISASLFIFANAIERYAEIPLATIAKGMLGIGASLGILVFALNKMNGKQTIATSLALMSLSGALIALGIAFKLLGSLSWEAVAIGLGVMAGSLLILGVAGTFLAGLITPLLALAGVFALLGIGMAGLGAGVFALAAGLAALAGVGAAGILALGAVIKLFIESLPALFASLGTAFAAFFNSFALAAPIVADALRKILLAFTKAIVQAAAPVANAIMKIITIIMEKLLEYLPHIVDVGMQLFAGLLQGIAKNIKEVTIAALHVVMNFIAGIMSVMGEIVNAGMELLISFIDGITKAVDENGQTVITAIFNLFVTILKVIGETLLSGVGAITGIGEDVVQGFINGINNKIKEIKTAASNLGLSALNALKEAVDSNSPAVEFIKVGDYSAQGYIDGMVGSYQGVKKAAAGMGQQAIDGVKESSAGIEKETKKSLASTAELEKKAAEEREKLAKEEFDKSVEWIDDRKYYNELSLNEELEAWERVQEKYLEGTEQRKKADREVYRVKKELINEEKDYAQKVIDIARDTIEKRKDLEQEYHDKVKAINESLVSDIAAVEEKYESALQSRTDALYDAYGLFDKVEKRGPVSGTELIQNLKDQVNEFETWQQEIATLSSKGVSTELIDELEKMGPKSLSEIQALNALSQPELDEYVMLWREKTANAKEQAVSELSDLRIECNNEIRQLNIQAEADLEEQRRIWDEKMKALSDETIAKLDDLTKDFLGKVGEFSTDTQKKFAELTKNIQEEMTKPDWFGLGTDVVEGMREGMRSKATALAWEAAQIATDALEAAKIALASSSPSKKFMELGMFSVQGFAIGLSKYAGIANTAATNLGLSAIANLKDTISKISDKVTQGIDTEPVIRPVLDLSNVEAGSLLIDELLAKGRGLNVAAISNKIPDLSRRDGIIEGTEKSIDVGQKPSITFNQHNYSPKALSRLDIYRQTRNQLSAMKGVLNGV